jgi:hypothetical protein
MIPALTLYQVSLTDIAKSCLLLRVRNNEIEHGKNRCGARGKAPPSYQLILPPLNMQNAA